MWGLPLSAVWIPAPEWCLPRAAAEDLLHHGPLYILQENTCSGAWSTFFPSFSDLVPPAVSHFSAFWHFCSFLSKFSKAPETSWMWLHFGLLFICCRADLFHRCNPYSLSQLPIPGHINPIQRDIRSWSVRLEYSGRWPTDTGGKQGFLKEDKLIQTSSVAESFFSTELAFSLDLISAKNNPKNASSDLENKTNSFLST